MRYPAIVLMSAVVLAACGPKETVKAPPPPQAAAPGGMAKTSATAHEVAREARGKVGCPAVVKTAARDAAAPVDDVLGVRPGMAYEEAVNVILCTNDELVIKDEPTFGFQINTYGQKVRQGFSARHAEPFVQRSGKEILQQMQEQSQARSLGRVREDMKPGESNWYVGTIGMPGYEQVMSISREERFAEGRNPPVASLQQALLSKYGKPTRVEPNSRLTTWSSDALGRPVTETSPLYQQCVGAVHGGIQLVPDCGVVVAAAVVPLENNPELAKSLVVRVVNQARGYERLTATEQGLLKAENDRRAKQVQDAAKNASVPKL